MQRGVAMTIAGRRVGGVSVVRQVLLCACCWLGAVAVWGASANPASAAAATACAKGTTVCLAGVVRNETGAPLTWRPGAPARSWFALGAARRTLPASAIRPGSSSGWALGRDSGAQPVGLFLDYQSAGSTYELTAGRSLGRDGSGKFVACWEPAAQGGGTVHACSAIWGSGSSPQGGRGQFVFGSHPTIPSVGERCTSPMLRAIRRFDCTAGGQLPALDGHGRPFRMALEFINIGAGPARVSAGFGHGCLLLRRHGACTLATGNPNAHISIQNLALRRAVARVEIVGEADGPAPPARINHWRWSSRAGSGVTLGVASSDQCDSDEYGQNGAVCDQAYQPSGSPDESNWMQGIPDGTLLSQLTLPGTHDTGTWDLQDFLTNAYYQAQSMDVPTQLAAGIRAIDIRVENDGCPSPSSGCPTANPLGIFHGGAFTNGYLNSEGTQGTCPKSCWSLMPELQCFLQGTGEQGQGCTAHPGETIVMNIQDEASAPNYTPNFQEQVNDVLDHYEPGLVYNGAEGPDPPLSAIRGKVVVMTQQGAGGGDYTDPPSGISWSENDSPNPSIPNTTSPHVQDNFSCPSNPSKSAPNNNNKWASIQNELSYASQGVLPGSSQMTNGPDDLNINFTSAECDASSIVPLQYAGWNEGLGVVYNNVCEDASRSNNNTAECNELTMNYLNNNPGQHRYGIIYSDFPGTKLIQAEIAQNP
jgi:1-phosphatidylinositol phosphodiesterase